MGYGRVGNETAFRSERLGNVPYPRLLLGKLATYVSLTDADLSLLQRAFSARTARFPARGDVLREQESVPFAPVVLEGWGARYRSLPDGRRQLTGFLLPGDICGEEIFRLRVLDHAIAAVSPLHCALLGQEAFDMLRRSPTIAHALDCDSAAEAALQREWIAGLGVRNATERIACLLCELCLRLRRVGQAPGDRFWFPLTQNDLAEAAGISTVHVNRVVATLRRTGLVQWRARSMHITDLAALMRLAQFSGLFLSPMTCGQEEFCPVEVP